MRAASLTDDRGSSTTSTGSATSTRRSTSTRSTSPSARPAEFNRRFGHVLDYMARVELEVDRNVLELTTMLPDPPEIDRALLRRRLAAAGDPARPDPRRAPGRSSAARRPSPTSTRSAPRSRSSARWPTSTPFQDVCRMLYYLTGMATERSAVLAYNLLHDGVVELGEDAVGADRDRADPPPGARPLRLLPDLGARASGPQLAGWQRWLVRRMRSISFAPVGANNAEQTADFGDMMRTLGIDRRHRDFAEPDLPGRARAAVGAAPRACKVPPYVAGGLPRGRRAAPGPVAGRPAAGTLSRAAPGAAIQAMSSAVSAGVAEGCMTWLSTTRTTMSMAASRCAASSATSYGVDPLGDDQPWRARAATRRGWSAAAAARCRRRGWPRRPRAAAGCPGRARAHRRDGRPDRVDQVGRGGRRRPALTTPRKRSSSRRIIASASPAWCRSRCRRSAG